MTRKIVLRKSVARMRGIGFILWHSRHEFYHIAIGLLWAWFLRERWGEFNFRWVALSVFGSLLPDADHFWYFFTYGKEAPYTQTVKELIRDRKWRMVAAFIESGHKDNTSLTLHNYYFMAVLLGGAAVSLLIEFEAGVILFGAMLLHYLFDVVDDIVVIGSVNPNWRRWGNGRKKMHTSP